MNRYSHKEKHSLAIRIWHWTTFIVITGSLVTVLIQKTFLNRRQNTGLIQQKLLQSGTIVSQAQAKGVAGMLSHRVWEWHSYIGLVLAGLFLFRVVLECFLPGAQRFPGRLLKSWQLVWMGKDSRHGRHYFLVTLLYAFFYLLLAVIVITGVWLTYADDLKWLHDREHFVKEVHNFCMYLMLAFIALHIGGVIVSENKEGAGIVSGMINGGGKPKAERRHSPLAASLEK